MQSFLDRDKPQRLFKRKCTDFMRVEEFYVEFVIFNKRSSSFIEGPASWRDRQTVQVSVCFQNYSSVIIYLSIIHHLRSDFYFLLYFASLSRFFFFGMPVFFSARTIWAFPPLFAFKKKKCMKSYKYRHLLTMDSIGDRCQQLFFFFSSF